MNEPLVSILTITLNRASLIHKCIESIQGQTYKNYEHIIVDGNSEDDTEEVVKSYNDSHIKYIKINKKGPEIQMRTAFEASQGEFITFLDDDDEYVPEKIEKQVAFALKQPHNVGLTYCWMTTYDFNTNNLLNVHRPQFRGNCGDICAAYGSISGTPTLFIRRDIFSKVGGSYDDSIGLLMSDIELVARITQITDVDFLPESLVNVYINHGYSRLTTDFYTEKTKKMIVFHEHFLKRFSDVFARRPQLADDHYFILCRCYFKLRNYKKGFFYYKKLLRCKPSASQVFKPLVGIVLNK